MPEIISRKEAIERGLKRYFTGKPCKHGHVCERGVKWTHCVQCHIESGVRWAKENPEKRSETHRRHRNKNPEKFRKRVAERYRENLEKNRARNRKYSLTKGPKRARAIVDLLNVLRVEMPDLLKEFGL